jgi:DNA-binding CsgD family transcriptional regulator
VTISKHFQSLRKKLGARTTEQALAIALRDRLLPL